jgi:signal transduction histidine kinase
MGAPLLIRNTVVGAITFTAPPWRKYTKQDLELALELTRRASLSLENARLYRRAQEALHLRDEFLSIAAHEIRGPIMSIRLAVQGLQQGRFEQGAMASALGIIERNDARLTRFVDELLDLGRIRTGRLQFDLEEVALAEVVADVAKRFGADIAKSGSALSVVIETRVIGQWDRSRIDQVVSNLLSNAVKFGSGKPIEIRVRYALGRAELLVVDHGVGIDKSMLERVFEPFERAASARHYGGLGLGLHIVKTIVEGMGGHARVESELGRGATFLVDLPALPAMRKPL